MIVLYFKKTFTIQIPEGIYMSEINIYCDESCHLEKENEKIMVVSCAYCPKTKVQKISKTIRAIKEKHKIAKFAEIKWKKVSKSKEEFYLDLLNYFLNEPDLRFRSIVIDKTILNHAKFGQDHNSWYYKMIYQLVKYIVDKEPKNIYNIYADKKENSFQVKKEIKVTKECLQSTYNKDFVVQNILSSESEIMQLTDFLQGAVSFRNRQLENIPNANKIKICLSELIEKKLNITLTEKNYCDKFNIFLWGVY